jgi:hypothetical protein
MDTKHQRQCFGRLGYRPICFIDHLHKRIFDTNTDAGSNTNTNSDAESNAHPYADANAESNSAVAAGGADSAADSGNESVDRWRANLSVCEAAVSGCRLSSD